jgi:hypothetical protein
MLWQCAWDDEAADIAEQLRRGHRDSRARTASCRPGAAPAHSAAHLLGGTPVRLASSGWRSGGRGAAGTDSEVSVVAQQGVGERRRPPVTVCGDNAVGRPINAGWGTRAGTTCIDKPVIMARICNPSTFELRQGP